MRNALCLILLVGCSANAVPPESEALPVAQSEDELFDIPEMTAMPSTLDFALVQAYLQANPRIRTLNQFISHLPKWFRNNFTLVFDSHGAQAACTTPDNPRIVFFTEKFVLAVSNDNGAPGCDPREVEMIDLHNYKSPDYGYVFHSVTFKALASPVLSEVNPASCQACHGKSPRPLFGPYFLWNGFYGSFDDTILPTAAVREEDRADTPIESIGYEAFMAKSRKKGIYRHLVWDNFRDIPNLGRSEGRPNVGDAFLRPNLALFDALREPNEGRIPRLKDALISDDEIGAVAEFAGFQLNRDCPQEVGSLRDLAGLISPAHQALIAHHVAPVPVPEDVWNRLRDNRRAFVFGQNEELRSYDPYAARHVDAEDAALIDELRFVPAKFWGYLPQGAPLNPTNTELPRRLFSFTTVGETAADELSTLEYLLALQGESIRDWFLPREGYWGSERESEAARIRASYSCGENVREKAIAQLEAYIDRLVAAGKLH